MISYVYKWTHIPTLNWYVGVHCGKNKNYVCSSKAVGPMIKFAPHDWQKTIIATGEYADMLAFETDILQTFDARNDSRSFNKHNNEGGRSRYNQTMTDVARDKIAKKATGRARPDMVGNDFALGYKHTNEAIAKITVANRNHYYDRTGILHTELTKQKISKYQQIAAKNRPQLTCVHCGLTGSSPQMKRWHMDNCKRKETQ